MTARRRTFRAVAARVHGYATQEMWGVFRAPWDSATVTIDQSRAEAVALPTPDRFYADPLTVDGRPDLILAEEMDFNLGYGRLVLLDASDPVDAEPRPVLDDGVHTSYPLTYRHGSDCLLVPERGRTGRLEYYRFDPEQATAELVEVALEGRHVLDPTITTDGTTHYLFFVDGAHGIAQRLELYLADSLLGPWTPHPDTPVANDVRWARPAGRLFRAADGRLLRPAQNCGPRYGASVAVRHVTELNPDRYREEPLRSLQSTVAGYRSGLHTLDVIEPGRCVFDAKTYRSALSSSGLRRRTVQRARTRLRRITNPTPVGATTPTATP
jgi:hypothetical protein